MKLFHTTPTPPTAAAMCSIARLVVVLQVLMTLVMPLRTTTTTALPVTSKPIESTAEHLAWQAWIMLPPEQKQLIKSRKVTPKSIFTLPHRVECPEGHQQVDKKCIPTVIGSNSVLIDPNVLGLVLGDAPADFDYDYDAEPLGENSDNLPYNPPLYLSDTDKSNTETILELKPPSKDEPLKFNIFQSKFPTDDYPMEDYTSVSNEGGFQLPNVEEKVASHTEESKPSQSHTSGLATEINENFGSNLNITKEQDLLTEASSNVSQAHALSGLTESNKFNLDNLEAISLPASTNQEQKKPQTISLFNEDAALHLVTSIMDTDSSDQDYTEITTQQTKENDLESLLQTESLMPMLNQSTASTILPAESLALIATTLEEPQSSSSRVSETFALHVESEEEEMTTMLPSVMDDDKSDMETPQGKTEYIRSVTMNPRYAEGDADDVTTLTPSTSSDEPSDTKESVETTTMPSPTIQLDDTTIIEGVNDELLSVTTLQPESSSPSAPAPSASAQSTPASESFFTHQINKELPGLLMRPQEQALKDFEELQNTRKAQIAVEQQEEQPKSKVEPVEVLSAIQTLAEQTMPNESTMATSAATTMDELITTADTVTPLLTVRNNNNNDSESSSSSSQSSPRDGSNIMTKSNNIDEHNNDRFYYQHFAKQDLESAALVVSGSEVKTTTETPKALSSTETATETATTAVAETLASTAATTTTTATTTSSTSASMAATSEIDLAEELRLINELVKGKRPGTSTTTATTTTTTAGSTPSEKTSKKPITTSGNDATTSPMPSSSTPLTVTTTLKTPPSPQPSESSAGSIKYTLETTQIWSKIMPLIKTTAKTTTTTSTTTAEAVAAIESSTETSAVSKSPKDEQEVTSSNPSNLIASNRSHRNSKIIRINGFNSLDMNPQKSSVLTQPSTTTTTTEDSFTTTTTEESDISSSSSSTTEESSAGAYEPFWWLPIAWRLDTPTTTTKKPETSQSNDDMPLLLRFWSTYHAPKSS